MIEFLKYANISVIYTKDLTLYNPEDVQGSINFCKTRGITFLPDKDHKRFWILKDNTFESIHINQAQAICNPTDPIFSKSTLRKFENNNFDNVLLVIDDSRNIVGVVHIVDYNKDVIYFELFKLIFNYERMLREYLSSEGFNNLSFQKFVSKQKTNELLTKLDKKYWHKRYIEYFDTTVNSKSDSHKKQSVLDPFQAFYFSDLIAYYNSISLPANKISQNDSESIICLRNRIAHGHSIISNTQLAPETNFNHLYDFKGLTKFIDHCISFFKSYENLEHLWKQAILKKLQ